MISRLQLLLSSWAVLMMASDTGVKYLWEALPHSKTSNGAWSQCDFGQQTTQHHLPPPPFAVFWAETTTIPLWTGCGVADWGQSGQRAQVKGRSCDDVEVAAERSTARVLTFITTCFGVWSADWTPFHRCWPAGFLHCLSVSVAKAFFLSPCGRHNEINHAVIAACTSGGPFASIRGVTQPPPPPGFHPPPPPCA